MLKRLLPFVALLPNLLNAQDTGVIPFTLDGALDSATADTSDYNTGGKISVNGVSIKIPKNLQFQFPAAFVGLKKIAAGGFLGNEVVVSGNYVNGEAIAGQVSIAQFQLEANSGKIKSLGFDGKITLVGGQVVRINDPNKRFSAGYGEKPEFTADDVNPSVTAFSGFPMCVPRSANDEACPQSNRLGNSFTAPDPMTMSPLKEGDYIEFEGIKVGDEIIAYGMVAPSVQILTSGVPPFIRVEDMLIGVWDTQNVGVVEFADSRMIGVTSEAGATVTISRIEIDPCTGEEHDVVVGSATAAGARNKWTWRADSNVQTKYAREYKATANAGTKLMKNGEILAGQYVAPVDEWIFPEITAPGTQPGKLDFTQMTHLRDGIGPDDDGNMWGQLSPWPDTSAPEPFKKCDATNTPPTTGGETGGGTGTGGGPAPVLTPTANAGADLKLRPGVAVKLAGKADNAADFKTGDLTYSWVQTSTGTKLTLTGADTATASFTLPSTAAVATYTFELTVKSKSAATESKDTVIVTNDPKGLDTVTVNSYTWTNTQGGTISVTAQSNVVDNTARLTLQLLNPNAGNTLTMVNAGNGKWTYNARSTKQPSGGVRVTSNLGGVGTKTTLSQKLKRWHARFFENA